MKIYLVLLATIIPCTVLAGTCGPPKEYAQYKDGAKTKQDRESLADTYCLYNQLHQLQQAAADKRECRQEQGKIMDALSAANDQRAIARALGGCPDIFNEKTKSVPPTIVYRCEDSGGAPVFSREPCEPQGMRTIRVIK